MSIPIENLYYLLCYAWNQLEEKDRVSVSVDDTTSLLDLLAKILISSTRVLLKRGLDRSYLQVTAEFAGVKGKLRLNETLKKNVLLKKRTVCSFDEYSPNIPINQILFSTLWRLLRIANLDSAQKGEIKKVLWHFSDVEPVTLSESLFKSVRLNRNNKLYRFVLNVCLLIHKNTLLNEETGEWKFSDFSRDAQKMNILFEEFLRKFYALEQSDYKVKRENIAWQLASNTADHLAFLPLMKTDITLESSVRKIIIEAKFYKETLKRNFEKEKISSANLYQLFSYLMNQRRPSNPHTLSTIGILVYPTVQSEVDLKFHYLEHEVHVRTVNLNLHWELIDLRLKEILIFDDR